MTFNLNAYLEEHKEIDRPGEGFAIRAAPLIKCMDGLTLSAQVGWHTQCEPRDNDGPYTLVEVGFPTMTVLELLPYKESDMPADIEKLLNDNLARRIFLLGAKLRMFSFKPFIVNNEKLFDMSQRLLALIFGISRQLPVNSIYPYTPVEIVEKIVEDHGGLWTEERTGMEPALGQGDVTWTHSDIQDQSQHAIGYDN